MERNGNVPFGATHNDVHTIVLVLNYPISVEIGANAGTRKSLLGIQTKYFPPCSFMTGILPEMLKPFIFAFTIPYG